MKKGLFAGSFSPPTLGHLDIIKRASHLCDKLYIAVAENSSKNSSLFSLQERLEMLKLLTQENPAIEVVSFGGLAIDFARKNGISFLIRSMRNNSDFDLELAMSISNKKLGGLETVFLLADPAYIHIHGELVREIALLGGSLKGFVPPECESLIEKKFSNNHGSKTVSMM